MTCYGWCDTLAFYKKFEKYYIDNCIVQGPIKNYIDTIQSVLYLLSKEIVKEIINALNDEFSCKDNQESQLHIG